MPLEDGTSYTKSINYVVSANTKTFGFYFQTNGTTHAFDLHAICSAVTTADTSYTGGFDEQVYSWEARESYTNQGSTATLRWYDAYGEATGLTNEYDNKMYHGKVSWTIEPKEAGVQPGDFTVTKHSETIEKDKEIVVYYITQT